MRFYYTVCGHLVGCDDPTFDLAAEQARRRKAAFDADMAIAIETGKFVYRSSSPLNIDTKDALNVVAGDPSPENIWKAQQSFDAYEEWHAAIDAQTDDDECGCEGRINDDDPNDVHWQSCTGDCKS